MISMYKSTIPWEFERSPIDIHSHFNHGSAFDCPETPIHLRGLDFIESMYRDAGVLEVGCSTYASVLQQPECVVEENEYMYQLIEQKEWVYQWVVIDPRQPETFRQAQRMLSHPKVLGIKIHPTYHGYSILEYGDAIFSFADQYEAVVLMHPQYISDMPSLVDNYPNMKLIIAHLGGQEHIDAVAHSRHGNIYIDTSSSGTAINHIVEYAVERVGSEKILFGTDTYAFGFSFGRIAFSPLPLEDKENILWKNAVRLFPKAFQ